MAIFLASAASNFITGQVIHVDGGVSSRADLAPRSTAVMSLLLAEGDRTMPNKQEVMESLKEIGVVAVIRADDPSDLIDVGRALTPAA